MNKKIIGKVIQIKENGITILVNDEERDCLIENISDYACNLNSMFKVNKSYIFTEVFDEKEEKYISYKYNRPKLNKYRPKPMPTISGFKNVSNKMHTALKKYKV